MPPRMRTPIRSPHAEQVLQCLQWQGRKNDCGPYTTATVINAVLGKRIDAAELAEQMNKPRWRGPLFIVRRVPNWATFPWGIADVLREHGLKATWRFFNKAETIQEKVERGAIVLPVVGSWKPLWAHVMTLVEVDPEKGWGFANTQYEDRRVFWLDDETFRRQWRRMGNLVVEVPHVRKAVKGQ